MMTKVCTKCLVEKPLSEFGSYKRGHRKQVRPKCRTCENAYKKEYRRTHKKQLSKAHKEWRNKDNNRQNRIVQGRKWRQMNPDYRRAYMLQYHYGLTPDEHKNMYLEQNGCCAICNTPIPYDKIRTDHNHQTGKVRGLLCAYCNHFLAGIENEDFFSKATAYLDERN